MINGWYHLQPESPGSPQQRELDPAFPSTERFYQQMKSVHARAAAKRQEAAVAAGASAGKGKTEGTPTSPLPPAQLAEHATPKESPQETSRDSAQDTCPEISQDPSQNELLKAPESPQEAFRDSAQDTCPEISQDPSQNELPRASESPQEPSRDSAQDICPEISQDPSQNELPKAPESPQETSRDSVQGTCPEISQKPSREAEPPAPEACPAIPAPESAPAADTPSPAALPEACPNTAAEAAPPAETGRAGYRPPTQHELERAFAKRQRMLARRPQALDGERGPHSPGTGDGGALLQDARLHETLAAFLYAQGRQRAVHAKGYGALGYFLTEHPMGEFTTLSFLQTAGKRIPVAARFSLAAGGQGAPDMARGIRGLAVKLYADDGNFDLLCNHIPVFPVRDALRFPALIQALGPDPASGLHSPQRFWEFAAAAPEAAHFLTWLYADTGTPKSLRQLRAGSVNTYTWLNGEGERRYVRYHLLPAEGESSLSRQEAARCAAEDPDMAGRELFLSIEAGRPAEYALLVQLMEPQQRQELPYDPLDATKLWDEQRFPLLPVGRLVLDRNPVDYRQQVENLAFSPLNLLPGAGLSEDRLLLGRALLYWDAQRLRLGEGFRSLPVNCRRNRAPWTPADVVDTGLGEQVCGEAGRFSGPRADDFTQAGEHYRALPEIGQEHLIGNIAAELSLSRPDVQAAILGYLAAADAGLAAGVAKGL